MKGSASKVSLSKTNTKDVFIDDIDMKDEMKRLQIRLHYLVDIKNDLNMKLNICNDKVNTIKRDHDKLQMKTESFREEALLKEVDDTEQKVDSATDKRLNIANRKLEISILNKEIKGALKGLEDMALDYESRVFSLQKNADKATSIQEANPFLLSKSDQELDEIYGDLMEDKFRLQALINNDIVVKKREKDAITRELSRLKETLVSLLDEKEMYEDTVAKSNRVLLAEQSRCTVLQNIQGQLRNEIGRFHNGRGWEVEAFLRSTGSYDGHMNIVDVPRILSPWLSSSTNISLDAIYSILHLPPRDDDDRNIDIDSFFIICDNINGKSSALT